jgi:hypothetical protein
MTERNALYELGKACMLQPPVKLELNHLFADGLYGRIITMPADTVVMTAIHKKENITTVVTGKCRVVNPDGTAEIIIAPAFFVTPANTQRAVYVIEESTWIIVCRTRAKTVEDAEQCIATMPDFFNEFVAIQQEIEKEKLSWQ